MVAVIKLLLLKNENFLREAFDVDGEDPGPNMQCEVKAEVYPAHKQHTANRKYRADRNKDSNETKNCTKIYPESSGITGGLTHITCSHGVTKGYTSSPKGESVKHIADPIFNRFPKRIKAKKRTIVYDNGCNLKIFPMRRYPWRS